MLDLVSREQGRTGYTHLPRIALTLPSGWFNYNGWAINDGGPLGLSFWDVAKVYPTPCRWQGKPKIDPGRTVDGLARCWRHGRSAMPAGPRMSCSPGSVASTSGGRCRARSTSRGARLQGARPYRAFAEVYVSLYKTHRDALVALGEPAYGPIRTLPNGVRMRTLVSRPSVNGDASRQVGWVGSVVGKVFIYSQGQGRPPAYRGKEAVRAQLRIHRRIQTAVLRLR